MPRFPVAFGKRKSTANNLEDASVAGPSFRVLDRSEVAGAKSFDGGARLAAAMKAHHTPQTSVSAISLEDNLFAGLKINPNNRGSGSSNTTKTISTDNSSRHSNLSTAPSSADLHGEEDGRSYSKPMQNDLPTPPAPSRSSGSGFLKSAGRSWSLGGQKQKKQLPPVPAEEEPMPEISWQAASSSAYGRARATTASTATTVTPPQLEADISLDLGGDFSKLVLGFDKRASVATVLNDVAGGQASATRNLTGSRPSQPAPIHIDQTTTVEASPYSWTSQHSDDRLLTSSPALASPTNGPASGSLLPSRPPPRAGPQRKPVPAADANSRRSTARLTRTSTAEHGEQEDEEARLLKDSLSAVNKFMSGGTAADTSATARNRRNDDTIGFRGRQAASESRPVPDLKPKGDNLFDSSFAQAGNLARHYVSRQPSPPRNKVMTPAQFERYREDRERRDVSSTTSKPTQDNEEEDNYEDEDDEAEKAKQAAKQRRKQEAHMTVYRQQMMKVTGESSGAGTSRPSLQVSFSSPNLMNIGQAGQTPGGSDGSEEDEEVPLAILAAHGFPSKSRPPTRLSVMASNPNLRASQIPSYQRPGSVVGDAAANGGNSRLPAFAKHLPQDPFLGAGLVHNAVRESFALGGGGPAVSPGGAQGAPAATPGGLIGVIASEERSRAMRRGSPHIDGQSPAGLPPNAYDPMTGMPANMMYPGGMTMSNPAMLTPGDQAQMHMTQQMQQFMQMQMQFMQMMATQNANGGVHPMNPMAAQSMGHLPNMASDFGGGMADGGLVDPMMRHSFVGDGPMMDMPAGGHPPRAMSMVGSSSAPWIQGMPPQAGYTPSIRAQGFGYAPSIAPSERSNVGLPGRYRPVSQAPPPLPFNAAKRTSTAPNLGSSALAGKATGNGASRSGNASDEDEDQAWANMKMKRDKKRSIWRTKKTFGSEIGALIS